MSESIHENMRMLDLYIQKGEFDRAKNFAFEVIQADTEEFDGYLLMATLYNSMGERDLTLEWINETLQIAPENESVLIVVISIYNELNDDELKMKMKELVELGLRLYPENGFFHNQYAIINQDTNIDVALASYEEAIRLIPQNDKALADYAHFLYENGRLSRAQKYEQLALQANSGNAETFCSFAKVAFEMRRYKKAQSLIQEATRLDSTNPEILEWYKKIYPTKNVFIRLKNDIDHYVSICYVKPSVFLYNLFKQKISVSIIFVFICVLEFIGLCLLFRGNLLVLIGIYLIINFICSKIAKLMLNKVDFIDEEDPLKKKVV